MNPNDLLVAVSGYDQDLPQIERLLPHYLAHGAATVILSPADAPIKAVSDHRVHCMWVGEREWAGPKSLVRHKLFLERMLSFVDKNWFLFNDSDSVVLSPKLPDYLFTEKACFSNEVQDLNTGTSYLRKIATQPPYFFHRDVLTAMHRIAVSGQLPVSYYGPVTGDPIPTSAIDHYHMLLSYGSGFPLKSFPDGASFETTSDHGLNTMAEHVGSHGKIFIHQVKSQRSLDRLLAERKKFCQSHR